MIYTAAIFATLSFVALFIAYRLNFFSMSKVRFAPQLKHGLLFFVVYLLLFFFFTPTFFALVEKIYPPFMAFLSRHEMLKLTLFHLCTLTVSISFLIFFAFYQKPQVTWQVIKSPMRKPPTSILNDLKLSLSAYIIIVPLVTFISSLFQWIIITFFRTAPTEQIAVQLVKTLEGTSTSTIVIFFISIAIIAPIIEELAFRGMLQNGLKQKLSTPIAVIITSAIFSALHLAISAGLSNLPLFVSLFTLSCMLGFLYERQHSLIAPIGLHIMFNSINLVGILFFKQ